MVDWGLPLWFLSSHSLYGLSGVIDFFKSFTTVFSSLCLMCIWSSLILSIVTVDLAKCNPSVWLQNCSMIALYSVRFSSYPGHRYEGIRGGTPYSITWQSGNPVRVSIRSFLHMIAVSDTLHFVKSFDPMMYVKIDFFIESDVICWAASGMVLFSRVLIWTFTLPLNIWWGWM